MWQSSEAKGVPNILRTLQRIPVPGAGDETTAGAVKSRCVCLVSQAGLAQACGFPTVQLGRLSWRDPSGEAAGGVAQGSWARDERSSEVSARDAGTG